MSLLGRLDFGQFWRKVVESWLGELLPMALDFYHDGNLQTRWDDSFLPGRPRLGAGSGGRLEASDCQGGNLLIYQGASC